MLSALHWMISLKIFGVFYYDYGKKKVKLNVIWLTYGITMCAINFLMRVRDMKDVFYQYILGRSEFFSNLIMHIGTLFDLSGLLLFYCRCKGLADVIIYVKNLTEENGAFNHKRSLLATVDLASKMLFIFNTAIFLIYISFYFLISDNQPTIEDHLRNVMNMFTTLGGISILISFRILLLSLVKILREMLSPLLYNPKHWKDNRVQLKLDTATLKRTIIKVS